MKKTIKLAQNIRRSNRKAIQPGLEPALRNRVRELDDFFEVKSLNIVTTKGKSRSSSSRPIVLCTSVPGLIKYIKARRNVEEVRYKIGIDGGKGSLKITLSIEECNADQAMNSKFKDSGVRRTFVIALASNVQENFKNIHEIWINQLQLNHLNAIVASDLKVINMLAGVMANSSSHPCPYCTVHKNSLSATKGVARTIGFVKSCADSWLASGGKDKEAKDYYNCVHHPMLYGEASTKIVYGCPPPSLHLFLGLTNAIYDHISASHPESADAWAKAANASRHAQFGFSGFTGRYCRYLVAKRSVLKNEGFLSHFSVLENLQDMLDACFGTDLMEGYQSCIDKFCDSWQLANQPITPKLHITKFHISEYCEHAGEGLSRSSEQTIEAIHSDFAATWENHKVPEMRAKYSQRLLSAVVAYNSSHI